MGNIIDYVKEYGDKTFKEHPFNEVDALVLSQFVYFKWEHVIPLITDNAPAISVTEMGEKMFDAEVFAYERYAPDNIPMWEAMVKSRRYSTMKCNYLSAALNDDIETQFCAFTVFPEDTLPIVLFRGTDETILGWKEDYNMAYDMPVTGQRLAALYIKQVALRLKGGFMTAGHSKGGNLAVYAPLVCAPALQNRITDMYCFDGPSFRPEILKQYDISNIALRIRKYIPQSSLVGMLLEMTDNYTVVNSMAHGGVNQHYPYSWEVKDGSFVMKKKLDRSAQNFSDRFNQVVCTLNSEQIEIVGDTLFDIIYGSEATTTEEILKEKGKAAIGMIKTMQDISQETKDQLKAIVKSCIKMAIKNT